MKGFAGYHSEWNLGSPGGWDYQRITQIIGKAVWQRLNEIRPIKIDLDFGHPLLFPVYDFVKMLIEANRARQGNNPGLIAVVAEEETLEDVSENINLVKHIDSIEGLSGVLIAPQELELKSGQVCCKGRPVSIIFMDFNTDVLLALHRIHDLTPLLQAVRERRVINPRGTEPINIKSMFEVITGPKSSRFHKETTERTPWTRQFYPRRTDGPGGESINDLLEWTRSHWDRLVLKPERGVFRQRGYGRHSLELCVRGFKGCTLLDYSKDLIDFAISTAQEHNYPMDFIRSDARNTKLASESFDHVLIMGNSLGYIQESDADKHILSEAYRLMRQDGWLFVDITDGSAVKNSFNPNVWHEIGSDTVVCRQRKMKGNTIHAREMVLSRQKGLVRDRTYSIRLYEPQDIETLLEEAGFKQVKVHTGFSPHRLKEDYGFMNHRMIATGRRM